jgi:hypothetical protein
LLNILYAAGVELPMFLRAAVVSACLLGTASAVAEELRPEEARAFVVGKLFAYTCFDGTAGMARMHHDGSVVGTIRPRGQARARFAFLPPGSIKVTSSSVCARVPGLPFEPCFRVQRTGHRSFRGSLSGFGFAHCDFIQRAPRPHIASNAPLSLTATAGAD